MCTCIWSPWRDVGDHCVLRFCEDDSRDTLCATAPVLLKAQFLHLAVGGGVTGWHSGRGSSFPRGLDNSPRSGTTVAPPTA